MDRRFALQQEPLRVGMILQRDTPPRLVQRFGSIMPDPEHRAWIRTVTATCSGTTGNAILLSGSGFPQWLR